MAGFPTEWRQEDEDLMKAVQKDLVDVLLKYTARAHPLLIIYAMMRCIRTLLRKTTRAEQRQIVPVLTAFLEGKPAPPEKSALVLPSNFLQ